MNADNGYLSDENSESLEKRKMINGVAPQKKCSGKVPKNRQNQQKCIEGIFGIIVNCFGLQ